MNKRQINLSDLDENVFEPQKGELKIVKRGPGRPRGTPNRPKGQAGAMLDRVQNIYKVIEHLLTPEQQEYYRRAFAGKEPFDPLRHAEFFALLYGVYAGDILLEAITEKIVSQDIAQTLREYRMALKELNDMKAQRAKEEAKDDDNAKLVDPTREPSKSRLDQIIERASKEAARGSGRRTSV